MSIQTFKRPLQHYRSNKNAAQIVIGLSLFIFLFCFVYRPFGQFAPPGIPWSLISLGFAANAFFIVGLNHYFLLRMIPPGIPDHNWTLGKELVFSFLNIITVGVFNFMLSALFLGAPANLDGFVYIVGFTAAVGIFPAIGIWYYKFQILRPPAGEALRSKQLANAVVPTILIPAYNGRIALSLSPSSISHLVAVGNYVKVYHWEEGKLRNQLVRTRLSELEKAFSDHTNLLRCHRSYIVNLDHITAIRGNSSGYKLSLREHEETIPVSRSFTQKIRDVVRSGQVGVEIPEHGHWATE